jgi:hypothetical protein
MSAARLVEEPPGDAVDPPAVDPAAAGGASSGKPEDVDAPVESEIDLLRAANAELRQQNAAMAHSPAIPA